MRRVDVLSRPERAERAELISFVERLATRRGARPLSDHLWLDLTEGSGAGLIVVAAHDEHGPLALAQISAANEGSTMEAIVDEAAADATRLHDDVVETAVDWFRGDGGGLLTWWVDSHDAHVEQLSREVGLELVRTLHELRLQLPLDVRSGVETRAFTPADADAWLRVNNRAFADHAEQGGWTRDTLELRLAEPWFDPDGFRLYEHDGDVAAFCWTKVHSETDPPMGEIYVIGVDPSLHGKGLGRELTLAGLDWMADQGLTTATLYVDGGNVAAMRLYEKLGFTPHRSRYAFAGTLVR